jgi:hypothetical protein
MAGAAGGAWLVGRWAVGLVVVGYSLLLAAFALFRDPDRVAAVADLDSGTEEDRFRRRVVTDLRNRMDGSA